jgi:hypothetical protein
LVLQSAFWQAALCMAAATQIGRWMPGAAMLLPASAKKANCVVSVNGFALRLAQGIPSEVEGCGPSNEPSTGLLMRRPGGCVAVPAHLHQSECHDRENDNRYPSHLLSLLI